MLCAVLAAFLPLGAAGHAQAQSASESIHELDFKRGERQIEFKAGTLKPRGDRRESEAKLGFSYGATDFWNTKLSAQYAHGPDAGTRFDAIEWKNIFRFAEPGRLPLDVGWLAEFERPRERSEGYRLKFGPLLQKDIGDVQLNLNLLFEHHHSETPSRPTEMGYQWQAKYNWREHLQFGLQGFGDMGEWDDWAPRSEQSHRFGPAIFGTLPFAGQGFKYKAAYLADPSSRARSHGFRLELEYRY